MVPFHPATPAEVAAGSPLGPSYILVPLPNDDDTLLGRVLLDVPDNGRSLDEVSRPNECADKLADKKEGPLASTFEDAEELSAGGKARAALGAFGFEGDAETATHFYYKLDVNKRVSQTDTTAYVACCKDKGTCGYGFVSSLIYGDGEYATATVNSAEGSVFIPVAGGAGGFVKAKILHKRNVHGYVAALVTVTDLAKSKAISVLGDPAAAGIELTEQNLPEQVKARFELQKIEVVPSDGSPVEFAYHLNDGHGGITENEFVRSYEAITGSMDLSEAKKNRHPGWLYYGISASSVGVALIGFALLLGTDDAYFEGHFTNYSVDPGTGIVGGVVLGSGLVSLIVYAALGYDGSNGDHVITKFDADLYVAKYNRALLRKTIQETEERMRQLSGTNDSPSFTIAPIVSPRFTGLVGRF
jgi:hypothetical protein